MTIRKCDKCGTEMPLGWPLLLYRRGPLHGMKWDICEKCMGFLIGIMSLLSNGVDYNNENAPKRRG